MKLSSPSSSSSSSSTTTTTTRTKLIETIQKYSFKDDNEDENDFDDNDFIGQHFIYTSVLLFICCHTTCHITIAWYDWCSMATG